MALSSGKVLARKYEILDPIGHGGMATVHRARTPDGQIVAIKTLHDHFAHDEEFLTRFEREARAAASLTDPNIVRVLESGKDRGVPFIAMEFVEGEDLKTVLQREGPLDPARATAIAGSICRALAYAHTHGIIHRDIKPQNILVDRDGRVKVTDFGIARAAASSTITQPGTVLGSVQYLSPEQARGDVAGQAADIYGLGVILYEMVTGRVPFEGDNLVAMALKHIQEPPPPPRSLNPNISSRVEGIILRALAKEPEARYPSAEVMCSDLDGRTDHWRDAPTMVIPPLTETVVMAPPATAASGPQRRGGLSRPALVALLPLAIFALMLTGWLGQGRFGFSAEAPDLRGKTLDSATTLVAQRHLQLEVTRREFNDTFAANVIVTQNPPPGRMVRRNGAIAVVVSDGRETVVVPDMRGRNLVEAVFLTGQARLRMGRITTAFSATAPMGIVVSQKPTPGARVAPGTAITVVTSRGAWIPIVRRDHDEDDNDRDHKGGRD